MSAVQFYIDPKFLGSPPQSGIFLVGGYSGRPNFGEYLQLKATIDQYEQLGTGQDIFLLLDASAPATAAQDFVVSGRKIIPVFYASGTDSSGETMKEMAALVRPPLATIIHIFGSGFANDWLGESIRPAVETLLQQTDPGDLRQHVFISGLHISASDAVKSWLPLLSLAQHVGAVDGETQRLMEELLSSSALTSVYHSGDDALPALITSAVASGIAASPAQTIAAHIDLTDRSAANAQQRIERMAQVLGQASEQFSEGAACDLLVTSPSEDVDEEGLARQIRETYRLLVAAGGAKPLTFRLRNIYREAIEGDLQLKASFLIAGSYHVALAGLLSNCATLLLVENENNRPMATGLADAFGTQRFAVLPRDGDPAAIIRYLLGSDSKPGIHDGYSMWLGQMHKVSRLASLIHRVEQAAIRSELEKTTAAFREVSSNLAELRTRAIIENRLAAKASAPGAQAGLSDSWNSHGGYWQRRKMKLLRSIKKRVDARLAASAPRH